MGPSKTQDYLTPRVCSTRLSLNGKVTVYEIMYEITDEVCSLVGPLSTAENSSEAKSN